MILKIGMYLLLGLIVQWSCIIGIGYYAYRSVGEDKLHKVMEHLLMLKIALYHKGDNNVLSRFKEWLDNLEGLFLWIWLAISLFLWPIIIVENAAVWSDFRSYVHEVKRESSES